jgi:hypothetical protein
MNEEALRALVRESVARHLAGQSGRPEPPFTSPMSLAAHPSQYRYTTLPESDGPCLIEPGVACNHCGYCQSHGH